MVGRLAKFRSHACMTRSNLVLSVVVEVLPVTLFFTHPFNKFGVQFPLFRIEGTNSGYSIIPITQDLNFVTLWMVLWIFGAGMILSGIILALLEPEHSPKNFRRTGLLLAVSSIFFLLSILLQYNFNFYNQETVVIPLGIPVMLLFSWWMIKRSSTTISMVE